MAKPPEKDSPRYDSPSYGSDEGGGFNAFSRAYKDDPSIERYVRMRRENPDAEIEVRLIGIDELFFMQPELKKYGIKPKLVASVLDCDPTAMAELSLQLLEKLIETSSLAKQGKTQLARSGNVVPDKLINWLIVCMLDAASWTGKLYIPRELIVLIRERLGGPNAEYNKASRAHRMRSYATFLGARLKAMSGSAPSLRRIAKAMGVQPSTVKRWFSDGDFVREVERLSLLFDATGRDAWGFADIVDEFRKNKKGA